MKLRDLMVRPLGRFYLVTALMGLTLITGMSTGFGLFYRLLYILGLTLVLNYVWNWFATRSLEVDADRRTRETKVGDTIDEEISIRNRSRIPKQALEVEDLTDLPGSTGGVAVDLGIRGSNSWSVQMPARRRGIYTMGPVRVANTDPFGMFRREKLFGGTDRLTVYPHTYDLPGFYVPSADLLGDASIRNRTHSVTPHASSVRDYTSGDSISRVHWNTTARLGKLMSKEFDLGRAAEVWVLIDLHKDFQFGEMEESTDEYAVSIGASLAKRYLEVELPVGLIAYGDQRYFLPAETGAGQMQRIMQYLAVCKAEGDTPLEVVLPDEEPHWSHHNSLIVITSSPRPEWVLALKELAKRGIKVAVVLVDGESFGGPVRTLGTLGELSTAGLHTYIVKKGDDIPTAMSRKYSGGALPAHGELEVVGSSA
jgi:uncharacterized protein (DUF58 family)